jgi:hypothetical protein
MCISYDKTPEKYLIFSINFSDHFGENEINLLAIILIFLKWIYCFTQKVIDKFSQHPIKLSHGIL